MATIQNSKSDFCLYPGFYLDEHLVLYPRKYYSEVREEIGRPLLRFIWNIWDERWVLRNFRELLSNPDNK